MEPHFDTQPPQPPVADSFEDWSDLSEELDMEKQEKKTETPEQKQAMLDLAANKIAQQESLGRINAAEAHIQDALIIEGGSFFLQESLNLSESSVLEVAEIDPGLRAVNEIHVLTLSGEKGSCLAAYKPEEGEQARFDPNNREPRAKKEWLGFVMDRVLSVDRSPAAVVRTHEMSRGVGSVTEWREGTNTAMLKDWATQVDPNELRRVADYHYLIGETDGRNGQFILEPDGRLTTIDRGESFMVGEGAPFFSEAITASLDQGLGASPEVLAAAQRFAASEILQESVREGFVAVFGEEDGQERYQAFFARIDAYTEQGQIPKNISLVRHP